MISADRDFPKECLAESNMVEESLDTLDELAYGLLLVVIFPLS
jgi:hypothetical protein